jgi:protein-L-isoaspartate(D-aspartate) O-methyltransferase
MNYETARYHMIEQQLRTAEVLTPDVVAQLYADRRENYVPAAYRALAFADIAIPLDGESGAAMLTPKLEARLLQAAALQGGERVLEIGAGSGHMAALLAERAAQVWTVEIDPALAERARANLANDGVANVTVETGDGLAAASPAAAQAPFDLIVVSGGVAEVPAALLAQLKDGGRLFAFVAPAGIAPLMVLRRMTRHGEGVVSTEDLLETGVPMLRQPAATRFVF